MLSLQVASSWPQYLALWQDFKRCISISTDGTDCRKQLFLDEVYYDEVDQVVVWNYCLGGNKPSWDSYGSYFCAVKFFCTQGHGTRVSFARCKLCHQLYHQECSDDPKEQDGGGCFVCVISPESYLIKENFWCGGSLSKKLALLCLGCPHESWMAIGD